MNERMLEIKRAAFKSLSVVYAHLILVKQLLLFTQRVDAQEMLKTATAWNF